MFWNLVTNEQIHTHTFEILDKQKLLSLSCLRFSKIWDLMSLRQRLRATTPASSPMVKPVQGSPTP